MAKNGKALKRGGRKSKAENSTGKRENEVEMRKASLDLQPIELKSDDFHMHFRSMKSAKEKMATAKNLYDGCCKAAKKVSPQLLDAVKLGLKIENEDLHDVKATLEVMGFVLKATDHPLQLTIHDTLLGDVKVQAFERGNKAGATGMPMACPYPDGSDLASHYANGWRMGQADLLGIEQDGIGHNSANAEQQAAE